MGRITNGATLRHSRIMDMLTFINTHENPGVTTLQIKAYMLAIHGLKFDTTGKYLNECAMAGFIREREGLWHVTRKFKRTPL